MKESLPEVEITSAPHGNDPFWRARHRIMTAVKVKEKTKREACEGVLARVSSCGIIPEQFSIDGVPLRRGWL